MNSYTNNYIWVMHAVPTESIKLKVNQVTPFHLFQVLYCQEDLIEKPTEVNAACPEEDVEEVQQQIEVVDRNLPIGAKKLSHFPPIENPKV